MHVYWLAGGYAYSLIARCIFNEMIVQGTPGNTKVSLIYKADKVIYTVVPWIYLFDSPDSEIWIVLWLMEELANMWSVYYLCFYLMSSACFECISNSMFMLYVQVKKFYNMKIYLNEIIQYISVY